MVRFNIVEGDSNDLYEFVPDFVELYNDLSITVKELQCRLGITPFMHNRLLKYCEEQGLIRVRRNGLRSQLYSCKNYVHKSKYGFTVTRKIDGVVVDYGTYRNYEDALLIVKQLRGCGWDKSQLNRIKLEVLGVGK